ncbi:MAG TPA: hypothetical protein VFQ39_16320, partial [Longimicrobium sp.]|nr:hypothetical protein [Longimicrobium sp.]
MRASPDVEAMPPEPIPASPSPVAGTLGARPPATPLQLVLSAILPGAGHLARGEWRRGMSLVLCWGVALGLAWLSWERVAGLRAARRVGVDQYLAVATLVLVLA